MKDKKQAVIKNDETVKIEVVHSKIAQKELNNLTELENTLFSDVNTVGWKQQIREILDSEIYKAIQNIKTKIVETDTGGIIARVFKKNAMQ